jgi:hypothetical protein
VFAAVRFEGMLADNLVHLGSPSADSLQNFLYACVRLLLRNQLVVEGLKFNNQIGFLEENGCCFV